MRIKNSVFCALSTPRTKENFDNLRRINEIARTANVAFSVIAVSTLTLFAVGVISCPPLAIGIIASAGIISALSYGIHRFARLKLLSYVEHNPEKPKPHEVSPYVSETTRRTRVKGFPTAHCAETSYWRKKLIRAAQHNVVLSGNYCGGKSFDEILDLLNDKLSSNPHFKVIILSSPFFIKDAPKKGYMNKQKLTNLQLKYPGQFQIVYGPNMWQMGSSLKYTVNHTKALVIDYGKYAILGGSAVKDDFNNEGVDNPLGLQTSQFPHIEKPIIYQKMQFELALNHCVNEAKKTMGEIPLVLKELLAYLKQVDVRKKMKKEELQAICEKFYIIGNTNLEFFVSDLVKDSQLLQSMSSFLTKLQNYSENGSAVSLTSFLIPRIFRDMDFVFQDCGGNFSQGRLLYLHLLALAHRLEHLQTVSKNPQHIEPYKYQDLYDKPAFRCAEAARREEPKDLLEEMLATVIPPQKEIRTKVPNFSEHTSHSKGKITLLCSGPEHESSELFRIMLAQIKNAKSEIVINHMYFNPPHEILLALQEAIRRGVHLKIITNNVYKGCPNSHKIFGSTNERVISQLLEPLSKEEKARVSVYMFQQKKKGLHKKVVIFDKKNVLAGSSNFGYKSLVTSSDHEINFLLKGKRFTEQTLAICDEDIRHSVYIDNLSFNQNSLRRTFSSYYYQAGTPIWG